MRLDVRRFFKNMKPGDLAGNFFQGLFILVPFVATVATLVYLFRFIDGWLGLPVPGAGFLIMIVVIIVVGRLASNVFIGSLLQLMDEMLSSAPIIKLLYNSIKDFISAFMGEKKKFNHPVLVRPSPGSQAALIGFITCEDMSFLGMPGHVAVYFPAAYSIAGNVAVFPRELVNTLKAPSAEVMAFLVSGGIAGGNKTDV